jgi:hypothetical protein
VLAGTWSVCSFDIMLLDGDAQENEGFAASSDRWASSMHARCSTHGVYFMMMDNKVSYIYVLHIAIPNFLFYPLSCLSYPTLSFAFFSLAFIFAVQCPAFRCFILLWLAFPCLHLSSLGVFVFV